MPQRQDLAMGAVYAAFDYYYDHKAEIDATFEIGHADYEAMKQTAFPLLRQKLQAGNND